MFSIHYHFAFSLKLCDISLFSKKTVQFVYSNTNPGLSDTSPCWFSAMAFTFKALNKHLCTGKEWTQQAWLLSLERAVCKADLGKLRFRDSSIPRNGKSGSLWLNCWNNMVCAEHLLSFWESGILVRAKVEGGSVNNSSHPPQQRKISALSLMASLVDNCHNSLLKEVSTSYVAPLGEHSWKLDHNFFGTSPQTHFLLLILLYIHSLVQIIAISMNSINPMESLDLGESWAASTQPMTCQAFY